MVCANPRLLHASLCLRPSFADKFGICGFGDAKGLVMAEPMKNCVLRIWQAPREGARTNRSVIGTGFLVRGVDEHVYAITCAHVVNAALGRDDFCQDAPADCVIAADILGRGPGRGEVGLTVRA
jgi:hypothetical protein